MYTAFVENWQNSEIELDLGHLELYLSVVGTRQQQDRIGIRDW